MLNQTNGPFDYNVWARMEFHIITPILINKNFPKKIKLQGYCNKGHSSTCEESPVFCMTPHDSKSNDMLNYSN